MKKLLTLTLLMLAVLCYGQNRFVTGKVSDGKLPLEKVTIKNLNREIATTSDVEGRYKIEVETGDKIEYSYMGMKTVSIKIEDVTRILNPILYPDVQELDEVMVEASKRRSQKDLAEDYEYNPNIINTAFGFKDAQREAGRVRMLTEKEIIPVRLCILDLLQNQFAGITVQGSCAQGNGTIVSSRAGSLASNMPFIFDVDGLILNDAPVWLDLGAIRRIAIFEGLAITSRYGQLGNGGVIVINTRQGQAHTTKNIDRAKLRNNYISGKILTPEEVAKNAPSYYLEISRAASFEEAKKAYENNESKFSNHPYYYLDAFTLFHNQFENPDFAQEIIDKNFALFEGNSVLLKALAYLYEESGLNQKAHEVYKNIFILRPNYAQSYLDLANSYRLVGDPKQAATIFSRYEYLLDEGFMKVDTMVMDKLMFREYNNLLELSKQEIVGAKSAKKLFVAEEEYQGTRLVFEWNDAEAEFDLQFVNPGNQYHMWKHTLIDNEEIINREKEFGFNTTEQLVDNSLVGMWRVNVNYFGNKSLSPTYLKSTLYYNYGTPQQRKVVKVHKLTVKNINQELYRFTVGGDFVIN